MGHVCFNLVVIAALLMSHGVSAKRGCSAFGHSCFGGHGKRSGAPPMDLNSELGRTQGEMETPRAPVYPHPGFVLPDGDDIIPVRDGGVYDRDDSVREAAAAAAMRYKLRNIVKHWMDSYRRSQSDDDGYLAQVL